MSSDENVTDLLRLREEWETARQCMNICHRADEHQKDNISVIDNYATGDALQFMVSTNGHTIHGKNQGLGWRTRQVGGHLSDTTVQQLSRDMSSINLRNAGNDEPLSRENTRSDEVECGTAMKFREHYGREFKLTPSASPDIPTRPSKG
ncbi:hypothetical protein TMEN_4473 [Trichophyton mentagrophytes]|nr:hypothetical protein TMEN_4473 [Trichophyton mentagrophytes]